MPFGARIPGSVDGQTIVNLVLRYLRREGEPRSQNQIMHAIGRHPHRALVVLEQQGSIVHTEKGWEANVGRPCS